MKLEPKCPYVLQSLTDDTHPNRDQSRMPRPFTFIHAADLHLDTPFSGIERNASAELAAKLRDATLDAFDRLVELCLETGAAFLVIAGDLCDAPERGIRAQTRLRRGFEKLHAAGTPVFIAAGNHDPLPNQASGGWATLARWPDSTHFFKSQAGHFAVERDGETLALVHGISYPKKEVETDLAAKLKRLPDDVFQVGVVHATLGEANAAGAHKPYAPTTMKTLIDSQLDYWALGHVHTRAVLRTDAPTVAYPGNIQALSSRETGPRGAYVVRVDDVGAVELEFAPLDSVRFAKAQTTIDGLADTSQLVLALADHLERIKGESDGRDVIVKLTLTGSGPLYAELSHTGALADLLEAVRDGEEGGEPLVWVAALRNRTSPVLDLDALRGQATLPATLLEKAERLAADEGALRTFAGEAFKDLLTTKSRTKMMEPDGAELLDELAQARDRALAHLAAGEDQ